MNTKNQKEDILSRAERLAFDSDLLIKQCGSWLSAEEGNKNMMKRIMEQKKKPIK